MKVDAARFLAKITPLFCLCLLSALISGCGILGNGVSAAREPGPAQDEAEGEIAEQWQEINRQFDEARNHVEQFEMDEAIAKCTSVLQYDWPTTFERTVIEAYNAKIFMLRGKAFLAKGFPLIAMDDFDDAVAFADDDLKPTALIERGKAAGTLQRWSRSIADCAQAIRLKPDSAEAFLVRSQALTQLGQLELARTSLNEAERLGIRSTFKVPAVISVVQQAESLLDEGSPGMAREVLGKAILKGQKDWQTYGLLAKAQFELNEYYRAINASNRAISSSPEYAEAWRIRGLSHFHRQNFDAAIVDLKSAVALESSYAEELASFLAEARRKGGMDPGVRSVALSTIKEEVFEQSQELPSPDAKEQWLLDLSSRSNSSDQISHFRNLLASTPDTDFESLIWLADFLMLDRSVPAIKVLRTYLNREMDESTTMPVLEQRFKDSIESRTSAAANNINLFADMVAYSIHYRFQHVLQTCIDAGKCRLKLDHMFQAVESNNSQALQIMLPHAILLRREVEGLLRQAVEKDRQDHVRLIVDRYEKQLTWPIIQFLGLEADMNGV